MEYATETATSVVLEWGAEGVGWKILISFNLKDLDSGMLVGCFKVAPEGIQSGLALALFNTQKMLQSNPSLQTPLF